jgi:hypothetical protein
VVVRLLPEEGGRGRVRGAQAGARGRARAGDLAGCVGEGEAHGFVWVGAWFGGGKEIGVSRGRVVKLYRVVRKENANTILLIPQIPPAPTPAPALPPSPKRHAAHLASRRL